MKIDNIKTSMFKMTGIAVVLASIVSCSSDDQGAKSVAANGVTNAVATTTEAIKSIENDAKPNSDASTFDLAATYAKSCSICHQTGISLAPRTHDTVAWEARTAKGMTALLASLESGLGAMPPKGMCFDCSDDNYQALIEFMAAPKP